MDLLHPFRETLRIDTAEDLPELVLGITAEIRFVQYGSGKGLV